MKGKSARARAPVLAVLCLYCLANLGCAGLSTTQTAAASPAAQLSISGTISPAANGAGVTVSLSGAASATATTDSSGNYSFGGLSSGSYTLTPTKAGYNFSPSSRQLTASASIAGTNFTVSSEGKQSGPIVINGQNGTVIEGLRITSNSGDCVKILNSTNITIQNSEIGPCAGNGIKISGGSGINVFDSYIHPETLSAGCCDHNDGIFAYGGTQNLWIQGNVIGYGEDNIQVDAATGVQVVGNFLLNPRNYAGSNGARGHQFQAWKNSSSVTVSNNYTVSSSDLSAYLYAGAVQDAVSFGQTTTFTADSNFVNGGQSPYGCAIIADTTTNDGSFTRNLVLDSGDCGIEISSGNNNTMDHNKVLNRNPPPGTQYTVALSAWASYFSSTGQTCTYGTVTNNIAAGQQFDGSYSNSLFAPTSGSTSCSPLITSGNILNSAAVPLLTTPSVGAVFPTPLIPPQPKSCVVTSPYSTQTSAAPCAP